MANEPTEDGERAPTVVELKRGSLRLSRKVYDTYFAGLEAVVLLPRDGRLLILPVRHTGGGGYLMKVINAAGDRAVHAADLLRSLGVDETYLEGTAERKFEARWSSEDAALVIDKIR